MVALTRKTNPRKEQHTLYLADVMTGVLATLAKMGVASLDTQENRIDQAFVRLYNDLKREARRNGLKLTFMIQADPLHGDSDDVHEELFVNALKRRIAKRWTRDPFIYITITKERADQYINRCPGTQDMYERLTRKFLEYYDPIRFGTLRTSESRAASSK